MLIVLVSAACKPSAVTILIGTNDCRSGPIDAARGNLSEILPRLSRETQARIAVLSIPPLGEEISRP
jgi:hypothetical protein